MKLAPRTFLLAFVAALIGVVAGRALLEPKNPPGTDIHAFILDQLNLDSAQKHELEKIERQFASRRTGIEADLRAQNALLADAIAAEQGGGPRVNAAIDRSHEAIGPLEKETLARVFAMRQLLRPDQAQKLDQAVVKALVADNRAP